ncbi:MAG TPA: hypothetical protein DCS93_26390 [Microscillaceae bacterium]|nr:hypothetical protein [Microscillaceae bacterium]
MNSTIEIPWQSVLKDQEDIKTIATETLHQVIDHLPSFAPYDLTLMGGKSGIILFYSYLYKATQNIDYYNQAVTFIEESLVEASPETMDLSLAAGYAGLVWVMVHVAEILDLDASEIAQNLDAYIKNYSKKSLQEGDYDYMYFGMGGMLYALEKGNEEEFLGECVDLLASFAKKDEKGIRWSESPTYTQISDKEDLAEDVVIYNLGLSHGISSIVVVLARCFKAGVRQNTCKELLTGIIQYFLNCKDVPMQNNSDKEEDRYQCHFSYTNREGENAIPDVTTNLRWCYGDLGITAAISLAGQYTQDSEWLQLGAQLAIDCARRHTHKVEVTSVTEAGLCHGTIGNAHIFNRLYHLHHLSELKEASNFWLKKGLEQYEEWGQKFLVNETLFGQPQVPGLLEGYAGIGLALMSFIYDVDPAWDKVLLLS